MIQFLLISLFLLFPLISIFRGYKTLSCKLPMEFEYLIKYQKILLRITVLSIFVLVIVFFTIWMTWEFAHNDVLTKLEPVIIGIFSVITIESIIVFIQSLRIKSTFKKTEKGSNNFKQKLEDLFILKEKGIISKEEFDTEKAKILNKT